MSHLSPAYLPSHAFTQNRLVFAAKTSSPVYAEIPLPITHAVLAGGARVRVCTLAIEAVDVINASACNECVRTCTNYMCMRR